MTGLIFQQWKYFFREVRPNEISATIRLTEGQEIIFGRGDPAGQTLANPIRNIATSNSLSLVQ